MPGPLTVVWKGNGYRVPKADYLIDVIKQTGPLFCSSANISGKQPILTSQEAFTEFKESLDMLVIVDNTPYEGVSQVPSTIIDLDSLAVIREGTVSGAELIEKLKKGNK